MSQWQDMGSAPKDKDVLVYWRGGSLADADRVVLPFVGIAQWAKPVHWPNKPESYAWRWRGDHLNFNPGEPAYWAPLPDGPERAK